MLSFDFGDLVKIAGGNGTSKVLKDLPQTQKDIRALAQATEEARSPEFQARLTRIETRVETYAKTQLMLQVVSTAAMVGLFVLAFKKRD